MDNALLVVDESTDRPYAKGYDRAEAIRVMGVLRGAALDPQPVDIFRKGLTP